MKDYELLNLEADRIFDATQNKEDLVKYMSVMRRLLATNPPEEYWENETLDRFLEALVAYLPDEYSTGEPDGLRLFENQWQLFALLIGVGAIYE